MAGERLFLGPILVLQPEIDSIPSGSQGKDGCYLSKLRRLAAEASN